MPLAHGRNLRKGRISEDGRIYLITTVTSQRCPFFVDFDKARGMVKVLQASTRHGQAETLAYVIMPDHLHWLMQLGNGHNLGRVIGAVKSISARTMVGLHWQKGFHDHAIREDEDLRDVARYVILNPVRAGLVSRIGDYPHWDAIWLGET